MLCSGAMARRWVGALHCLGSALTLKTQSVGNKRPGGPTHGHPPQRVVSSCRSAGGHVSENHLEEDATRLLRKQIGAWCTSVAPPGHSRPGARSHPSHTEETAGNSDLIERGERLRRQLSPGYRLRESRRRAREVAHLQVGSRVR